MKQKKRMTSLCITVFKIAASRLDARIHIKYTTCCVFTSVLHGTCVCVCVLMCMCVCVCMYVCANFMYSNPVSRLSRLRNNYHDYYY